MALVTRYPKRPDITQLRQARGENAAEFGQHFGRSGRTVEDWEQGRSKPDLLCERLLGTLRSQLDEETAQRIA